MNRIIENIEKELLSWPYVTAETHIFGGIEFRINKREMGHIHYKLLVVDLPFPMNVRNELVNSGHASRHHVLPQSGWVKYWLREKKIFLLLLTYLRCDTIFLSQKQI